MSDNYDRIINNRLENDTINNGIKIIDQVDSENYENLKVKSLGLQVTLVGLAEIQALRVKTLALAVHDIEKQLFNRSRFADLAPTQLMDLYTRANSSLNEASNYIKTTISSINWAEVEAQLALLSTRSNRVENTQNTELSKAATDLLAQLSSMVSTQPK